MNTQALETLQLEENKTLLASLKEAGDKSEVARIIVHKLEFISEYKKSDLLEELETLGFHVTEKFVTEEGYNGLMFQRENKTDDETIKQLSLQLIALLDEHDARYGGWITEVIC